MASQPGRHLARIRSWRRAWGECCHLPETVSKKESTMAGRKAASKPKGNKKAPKLQRAAKKAKRAQKKQRKKASKKPAPPSRKPAARAAKQATPRKAAKRATPRKAAKRATPRKAAKQAAPPKATPARDARQALELKKTIKRTLAPLPDGKTVVEAYLRDFDHPFKQEIEAVRAIILGASDKLAERIKWNAPSFHYKEDLGAFNPRATEYAHLILLFPGGDGMDDASGLLEGNHKDRREAKFHSLDDVKAKRPALEALVKRWVALRDR